ncbi:MAG TPA: FecR domain-containing protein [Chthoniobacterales bacterium]|nr:FecR domain-containing protein [Chthoniobacterales bacterium]
MKATLRKSILPFAVLFACAAAVGIGRLAPAAIQKRAHVTEVIRDVRLLSRQMAARPAAVNDPVNEGTAVRTGNDSRAELSFADQTITRLGANTVFSFGAAAHTYDLGSGAILMTAPRDAGTVKISAGVATCAVSGFTGIWESHSKSWNKVLILEGNGDVWLKKNPDDHRYMHSGQILVFPPNASVLPQPQEFDVSKMINNGLLITGFSHQLPSWPLLLAECDRQRTAPGTTKLVDPTNPDTVDQSINARPMPTPFVRPTVIPTGGRF